MHFFMFFVKVANSSQISVEFPVRSGLCNLPRLRSLGIQVQLRQRRFPDRAAFQRAQFQAAFRDSSQIGHRHAP